MRKGVAVCAALVLFSLAAVAQDHSTNSFADDAGPAPASSAQGSYSYSDYFPFQVSMNYQYVRLRVAGSSINLHGLDTNLTWFASKWFGLEANVSGTFGSTPLDRQAKFVFYGGGPHFVLHRSDTLEPWVHGLFGGAHLLPQTALGTQNAFAFVAGGGYDYKLNPRISVRVGADFLGTRFFSTWQKSVQINAGFVVNF